MESPEGGTILLRHLLQSQTDLPVQRSFQVVAALVPGQTEESLPAELSLQLVEELRPTFLQTEDTVGNAPIAGAPPSETCREVEVIVQEVGLKSLEGT